MIKLSKFLNEITYDVLNYDLGYSQSLWFRNVFTQFYLLYSIHYKIQLQQAALEVLGLLKIPKNIFEQYQDEKTILTKGYLNE